MRQRRRCDIGAPIVGQLVTFYSLRLAARAFILKNSTPTRQNVVHIVFCMREFAFDVSQVSQWRRFIPLDWSLDLHGGLVKGSTSSHDHPTTHLRLPVAQLNICPKFTLVLNSVYF